MPSIASTASIWPWLSPCAAFGGSPWALICISQAGCISRPTQIQTCTRPLKVLGATPLTDDCVAIDIPVAYWSKAKTIHDWFVNHVQDGDDTCGSYFVSREQVTALRDLCKNVLAGKAVKSALPPAERATSEVQQMRRGIAPTSKTPSRNSTGPWPS